MADAHSVKKENWATKYRTVLVKVDEIQILGDRRECSKKFVKSLARDIEADGLRTPISLYPKQDDGYVLITGLHRLEAFKYLGRKKIPAFVVTEKGADGWAITENWLRHQDDYLRQCCEFARLAELRVGIVSKGGKQPRDKGISKIAKAFGMNRSTISRMLKVASLEDVVLMFVREHGLGQRKTLLHKVSGMESRAAQIQMLQRHVTNKNTRQTDSRQAQAATVTNRATQKGQSALNDESKFEPPSASRSKIKAKNDRLKKSINAWRNSKAAGLYKRLGPNTQAKFIRKIFKREIIDSALRLNLGNS